MRHMIAGLFVLGLLAASGAASPAGDGRVSAGEHVEIDKDGRPNRDFLLVVQQVTPNIIHLRGKNGWVAFASFDAEKKEYRGFFEWPELPGVGRPGGKWADLFQIRVAVEDGVLRIEGKSAHNDFLIRARPTADAPR